MSTPRPDLRVVGGTDVCQSAPKASSGAADDAALRDQSLDRLLAGPAAKAGEEQHLEA